MPPGRSSRQSQVSGDCASDSPVRTLGRWFGRGEIMRRPAIILIAVCAALVTFVLVATHSARSPQSPPAGVGLHVSGRNIVEANGNPLVMRGVSHPYAWYKDQNQSFADIKRLGANSLRVVLSKS